MKANDNRSSTHSRNPTRRCFSRSFRQCVTLLMLGVAVTTASAITIGGTISGTRWTSNDSPILVVSNLTLTQGSMLILDSGVTMQFRPGTTFTVRGSLVFGSGGPPVVLTTDGPTIPGYWGGLKIADEGGGIFGGQCIIEYAVNGVSGNANPMWQPAFQALQLNDSIIRFCSGNGIQMTTVGFLNSGSSLNLYRVNVCSNAGSGIVFTAYNGPGWSEISGAIQNCAIFANGDHGIQGWGDTSKPVITRNVIWGNRGTGIVLGGMLSNSITENIVVSNLVGVSAYSLTGPGGIYYNDVWANGTNWLDQATNFATATGNFSADPLFLDPANGDFHLRSIAGRYDLTTQSWVHDIATSPCVDAGDPTSAIGNEPQPNGGRANLGADAGTLFASKSHTPWLSAATAPVTRDFVLSWTSIPGNNYQVLYAPGHNGPWLDDLPDSQRTAGPTEYSLSLTNAIATNANYFFRVRMTVP